jgi:cytochrome c oxidase subunit 2
VSYSRRALLRRLAFAVPLVTLACALLAGQALAASGSGLSPILPDGASPNGRNIHDLYNIISIPALFIFFLVEALLVIIIVRDRRRRLSSDYKPPQWHGNTGLEIAWTIVPFVLLVGIGVLSFNVLRTDFVRPTDAATDLDITISGHQFGWTYTYPEGFKVTSEGYGAASTPMVVPTGKLVRLKLQSVDVIHGWWVPELTGKTDLVPGYDNYTWIKVSQPGEYRGQCTELCGVGHNTMQLRVKAVSPAEYNAWAATQFAKAHPTPTPSPPRAPSAPNPSPSGGARPSPSPS